MRFGADLINLGWKDSCLGAADYSRMSKLLPTQPEWVMYYWCFVDMYRTKIFTWVTVWRAIFESVFFFSIWKPIPPGMYLSLYWRSRFLWYVCVICKESLFSRYDLVQDLDQLWWLCRFFLLSVQPHQLYTYSKLAFILLLAGMRVFSRACGSGVGDLFSGLALH